jgi:hypothetical protein
MPAEVSGPQRASSADQLTAAQRVYVKVRWVTLLPFLPWA